MLRLMNSHLRVKESFLLYDLISSHPKIQEIFFGKI